MTHLMEARAQMAMMFAFHILFAVAGITMPLLMAIAEGMWLKTKDAVYLNLARQWSKSTAVLFAVGAVSGTVLSFELGLLWPRFMSFAGPIIGMPFSLEGFAFFTEAIFLGIYIYGWDKLSAKMHWLAGLFIFISATMSGVLVVSANAWMNTPTGFDLMAGQVVRVRPFEALANPSWFSEALHMTLAAYTAMAFFMAGIHGLVLWKRPQSSLNRRAFLITLGVGTLAVLLEIVSGDISARHAAETQPMKLAAMEGQWETQKGAPLRIGGWPDQDKEQTPFALEIPGALSLLAYHDAGAEVKGLKAFPPENRPPVLVVHLSFQIMVFCGLAMACCGLLGALFLWLKKQVPTQRWFLALVIGCAPLGMLAVEAGWVTTEVGRQPWVINNLVRTADAVTPVQGLSYPFALFFLVYAFLFGTVFYLLKRQVLRLGEMETKPAKARRRGRG